MKLAILRWEKRWDLTTENTSILQHKDKLIIDYFKLHWINVVHVFLEDYNSKKQVFRKTYILIQWILSETNDQIKPDYIFNMITNAHEWLFTKLQDTRLSCSARIARIANNKYNTYWYFSHLQPKSQLLSKFLQNNTIWEDSHEYIIKPIYGSKWSWVIKLTWISLKEQALQLKDYGDILLVQEFIDASWWYPDIASWIHDVRIYSVGKKMVSSIVREPDSKDEFRACVHLWWFAKLLKVSNLPDPLLHHWLDIMSKLKPRKTDFFCMDFAFCQKRKDRVLIEINSVPWFRLEWDESIFDSRVLKWIHRALSKHI